MATYTYHAANTRGYANHGWLVARHTFSFASYHDAARVHFGALRVLNDDIVAGGMGFATHPHDNMEIITIPLSGALAHKDSMGNSSTIEAGEVQVMSAGSGVQHSEFNPNRDQHTNLLQIWVFPNQRNVSPRYDQIKINTAERRNNFLQVVSPDPNDEGTWIHQNAWFHLATFDKNFSKTYHFKNSNNLLYAFVIKGDFKIDEQALQERDGLGIEGANEINIEALSDDAEILLMEVPRVN